MSSNRLFAQSQDSLSPPPVKRKLESMTTSKAVASFFKPASQKEPDILSWRIVNESLIIGRYGTEHDVKARTISKTVPRRIAAFDLDDTLITATAGNKWGKSACGWRRWNASVPTRLKELYSEGFQVIIISNQGNISLKDNSKSLQKDNATLVNFKNQMTAVLRQHDLSINVYAATGQDNYRKPRMGMWQEMLEDYDLNTEGIVYLSGSFYVGDAAGRAKTDTRRKDHACSDRDLAANIGIDFKTPEGFFLSQPPETFVRDFEPTDILALSSNKVSPPASAYTKTNLQDIVMFCGSLGAGKSTFYWTNLRPLGYERINQDTLKSRERCLKVAETTY